MKDNKRDGKGWYVHHGVGWFDGNFSNDLKTNNGLEIVYKKSAFNGEFLNGLRN